MTQEEIKFRQLIKHWADELQDSVIPNPYLMQLYITTHKYAQFLEDNLNEEEKEALMKWNPAIE